MEECGTVLVGYPLSTLDMTSTLTTTIRSIKCTHVIYTYLTLSDQFGGLAVDNDNGVDIERLLADWVRLTSDFVVEE